MARYLIVYIAIHLLYGCSIKQQAREQYIHPNNQIGQFAKNWFLYINSGNRERIKPYDTRGEWNDYFKILRRASERVNGITPFLVSYQTKDLISIYAKENNGRWVTVNLGLDNSNEITLMNIKKSYKPVNYDLRNNLTKKQVHRIIKGIINELKKNYVIEESRHAYSTALLSLLESKKYDSITQGDLLAEILTKDLIKHTNDKHLQVISPGNINEVKKRFWDDENNGKDGVIEEKYIAEKLLENNIGVITINRFVDNEKMINDTETVMHNLSKSQTIIIDLTNSEGGDAKALANLMSYFFPNDELATIFPEFIKSKNLQKENTFFSVPLYVLTSKKTISAGEAFAYYLKRRKRAIIVGQKTAGAGYRVEVFKLPFNFYFVNSIYTSFDREKGEGWQGVGVSPNVLAKPSEALNKVISQIKKKQ